MKDLSHLPKGRYVLTRRSLTASRRGISKAIGENA
jgi:hypothetical protein